MFTVESTACFNDVLKNLCMHPTTIRLFDAIKTATSGAVDGAVMMDDGSICYEYRGTNSFNAIVPGTMVINAKVSSNSAADWNRYCAGKRGVDFSYARQAL